MKLSQLPPALHPVQTIVMNLWWSWHQEAWDIFEKFNPKEWAEHRNPIKTIESASNETVEMLAQDQEYLANLANTLEKLNYYMGRTDRWYPNTYPEKKDSALAYFSAEYGMHESLKIYSGGLGVLSGDHVKSASDLGLPLNFVGLFYHQGYFQQQINEYGEQVDCYVDQDANQLPLEEVTIDGKKLRVSVTLEEREVLIRVWKVQVGLSKLFLMDANLEENSYEDRQITARLYGGDRETRICQEIILGMGGNRALRAMGILPEMYHMNEGHSAFFQLERIANTMKEKGIDFDQAKVICQSNCLFTTHTPVPAGNEAFDLNLMERYFKTYVEDSFNISWGQFLQLGVIDDSSSHKYFSLTVMAIHLASFYNGVSELHGQIAQKMWKGLWPNVPESENPISSITNGIHVKTWCSPEMKELFVESLGKDWEANLSNPNYWEKSLNIDNQKIRSVRHILKSKMITMARQQLKDQLKRNGEPSKTIEEVDSFLDVNRLTIGFARRFATYKRATLIFKDSARLDRIINHPTRPVQFVFAGKAHPADKPGQEFIKQIYNYSREERFKGKIIFLENYNMHISRHMVAGVDVWLNNPRRPMEASGTSGQKVPINAGLNFSVLDGWWREGHNGENGWTIGNEDDYPDEEAQDQDDANNFYETLENVISPLFYEGEVSEESDHWIEKSKVSLATNIARYSTYRMVQDYASKFYTHALDFYNFIKEDENRISFSKQSEIFVASWPSITFNTIQLDYEKGVNEVVSRFNEFKDVPSHHTEIPYDYTMPGRVFCGKHHTIETAVYLAGLNPNDVICEAILTTPDSNERQIIELENTKQLETGTFLFKNYNEETMSETKNLRIRIVPKKLPHISKFELGLASWL